MFGSTRTIFNHSLMRKYDDLPVPCDGVLMTYVWIDATGIDMRCKDRTLDFVPKTHKDIPICGIDANCITSQKTKEKKRLDDVDILDSMLYPMVLYKDPFRRGSHVMALCEVYLYNYQQALHNHRKSCVETCLKAKQEEPWFGFYQEALLMDSNDKPVAWPHVACDTHYGVGGERIVCRDLMEAFYKCCLYAGVKMFGIHPGRTQAKWAFQVGPSPDERAADDLWMARFILTKLGEEYGVKVSYSGEDGTGWTGCRAYVYFSTRQMRGDDGILALEKAVDLLSQRHKEHMISYILGTHDGVDEPPMSIEDFTAGVGNRLYSIRIPKHVSEDKKGYFEDRRPLGNADPYRIIEVMIRTCIFLE